MADYPAALPHGPLVEVFPDIYVVRGTVRFMPAFSITRNMTIVRQGGELTLINSVRLTPEGEAELAKLGTPRHVVRIGSFHGMDDPYWKAQGLTYWGLASAPLADGTAPDRDLAPGVELPIAGAELFSFERGVEKAILLPAQGGVLITCDSVQNWTDFAGCSTLGRLFMKQVGFGGRAQIGPMWKKRLEGKQKGSLRPDFERLRTLTFRHVLSGHGDPLLETADDDLRTQMGKTFG